MQVTFAGIPINDNEGNPEVAAWIERFVPLSRIFPVSLRTWPGTFSDGPILNITPEEDAPVRINTLCWPWGASRFARAHFAVTAQNLLQIRAAVSPSTNSVRKPLVFSDGTNSVTASMWMLPAYPLTKVPDGPLYLLTMVDDRYWWRDTLLNLDVNEGTTTWLDLYNAIGTALGVPITAAPVNPAYGKPVAAYNTASQSLAAIFDAIAFSIGQRVVRSLSGSVSTQNPVNAAATVTANRIQPAAVMSAGQFDFGGI